ncbi:DOXA1-like protein [Mya arenaria]|uniref:DOXA1-like protein n=1 Tax=Mya arenaria TaxID=6604 RepID=A0ABY7DZN7_MYAAR|nr:DOXA1-like protein [Mya arenaria]
MASDTQSGKVADNIYSAFRTNGAPTFYGENKTAWQADILEVGFIFAGAILAASLLVTLPGFPGKTKWCAFIRINVGIFVGTALLICLYSSHWETAETEVRTKYKAGTGREVQVKVGLNIGLKGVNITLKANALNQEYRAAQFRGLPLPILWVAEYFTIDGEDLRWGRFFREAGLYSFITIWISLVFWVLSNIMQFMLLRYSAYLSVLSGLAACTAALIKHTLRAPLDLVIPFSASHVLRLHYGTSFWICLGTGGFCILWGLIVFLADLCWPRAAADFFEIDLLQEEKLLVKDNSTLSGTSVRTNDTFVTSSTNKIHPLQEVDLTEVVIDRDGTPVRKISVQPANGETSGASKDKSRTGAHMSGRGRMDDCWEATGDDWEDCGSSESDLPPTDEDTDTEEEVKVKKAIITKKKGGFNLIERFQRPRRIPSAAAASRTERRRTGKGVGSYLEHYLKAKSPQWITPRS